MQGARFVRLGRASVPGDVGMQLPALRCCGSASSAWPCLLHGSAKRTYTFVVRLLSRRTALNRTPMTTRGPVLRAARHGSSCRSGSLMWAFLRVSWGALFLDLRWRHSARAAMETMAQSSVSQMHGCLPASCERCTEQPWCLAPPSPPLSRLIGWPQNSGPYSGHPSGPPSLPPHSGVAGWGAWILGRFLAPDPGPLFSARMQPMTSSRADPSPSVGPAVGAHTARRRPPQPPQRRIT